MTGSQRIRLCQQAMRACPCPECVVYRDNLPGAPAGCSPVGPYPIELEKDPDTGCVVVRLYAGMTPLWHTVMATHRIPREFARTARVDPVQAWYAHILPEVVATVIEAIA